MAYPLSSDVTAGQPTAAAHYNNLRADALRLGQAAADGANLGDLLARFEANLSLEYVATNRVRVPASAASPAAVVIGGVPLVSTLAVDLPAGAVPSGAAAWWYVFAVQSAGSTAFTLTANTTPTEAAGTRRIGRFYWDGSAITQLKTEYRVYLEALTGLGAGPVCQGRLTLTMGVPVPTADATAATVLFFTPFRGCVVSLWSLGFGWKTYRFSELSVSLVGKTANKNHDVFLYDSAGTLTLELVEWTNDSTRATALVLLDGVYVKSGDPTRLYLGTIRTTATTGQCEDTFIKRYVWNYYGQVERETYVYQYSSHTYSGGTDRKWNNSDVNNKIELVVGVVANNYLVELYSNHNSQGAVGRCTLYIDGAPYRHVIVEGTSQSVNIGASTISTAQLAPGYHYAQVYENGSISSSAFYAMAMYFFGLM